MEILTFSLLISFSHLQDVYPSRTKSINYINTGSIFNAVFEISKYFMKEKTKKRVRRMA